MRSSIPLRFAALVLAAALATPAAAQNAVQVSSTAAAHAKPVPSVQAAARTEAVVLDGVLSEAVWSTAPAAGDFRQQEPKEGEPATQRTEVRFAFDDEALYVGARMRDTLGAAGVRTRLARRDQSVEGDYIQLVFDTFHDHTGRTVFQINPSGVKYDAGQASPSADPSWDPIWEGRHEGGLRGWTAELRIPGRSSASRATRSRRGGCRSGATWSGSTRCRCGRSGDGRRRAGRSASGTWRGCASASGRAAWS
jgi:hypothetical protein